MKNVRISILLFFLVVCVGCQNVDEAEQTQSIVNTSESVNELAESITQYKTELESLQTQITYLNEQNEYLIDIINKITVEFSEEEMLEFSQNLIEYELKVNGEPIPKNGELFIAPGEVVIMLSEVTFSSFLDPEWIEKGKISGTYIDHLVDFDTADWTITGLDGTVNTSRGYEKSNVQTGEQIFFKITDELKERLHVDTNLIQIQVK